jgi:hypothetical protein
MEWQYSCSKDAEANIMQLNEQQSISSLETLVVQQIEEMLREERALTQRYQELGSRKNSADMSVFSDELSRFDRRANRLYRLMEAMESLYPASTNASVPQRVAH